MIHRLELNHFRNYSHEVIAFESGIHLVTGQNAQGKTNLLEAIHLLSTGSLIRGSRDSDAIQEGQASFNVKANVDPGATILEVLLEAGSRKRGLINGASLPRTADLMGRLPTVCFTSEDLGIVRDDASARRKFMDMTLSQLHPGYVRRLAGYKRSLEQRNALLKAHFEKPSPLEVYEIWEQPMVDHGNAIREYRQALITELQTLAGQTHSAMAAGETLELEYVIKEPEPELEIALRTSRKEDQRRGTTTVGPHRDDFLISIANRQGRSFGSQGQQRTAAIALKLGVMHHMRDRIGDPPLVLLDDVLSELDEHRRQALIQRVSEMSSQCVLTCNEPTQAGALVSASARVYHVQQGTVTRI